jgi:hypothetical protein
MELALPTPVSLPTSLGWRPRIAWHTQGTKVVKVAVYHLGEKAIIGGYAAWCSGAIQGKEGRIQVLAGLAPSSKTVGSNKRVIYEQAKRSSWMTEANSTLTTEASLACQEPPKETPDRKCWLQVRDRLFRCSQTIDSCYRHNQPDIRLGINVQATKFHVTKHANLLRGNQSDMLPNLT